MDQAKNFAKVTVASVFNDADTSIDLITGDGSKLPSLPAKMVLWNSSDYPDPADAYRAAQAEVVIITAVATDTITVTRAQEGTDGIDTVGGKTYQMAQVITAGMWNALLGDVFGSGSAVLIDVASETIELRQSATHRIAIGGSGAGIEHTDSITLGDVDGNGNSSFVNISDANQRLTLVGMNFATSQSQTATVGVGTIAKKLPVYDESGTLLGYIPIYGSIT